MVNVFRYNIDWWSQIFVSIFFSTLFYQGLTPDIVNFKVYWPDNLMKLDTTV